MATLETTAGNIAVDQNEAEGRKKGISRSILIGLGGTGHEIVLDVRRRLIGKYGSLDKIPIIAYTVLDADAGIKGLKPVADDPALNKAINLDPADKIHTAVRGMDSLLRELPSYPHIKSWIDPAALKGDVELGAGAIRARGRLAFFWNYADIAKKFEEKYNQVKLKSNIDHTLSSNTDLTIGEGVTVYLVGSLMGGTGSGMFLDAAYTVRNRLPDAQIIGIFTIPPASGAVAVDNRANTYAALLELNHYSDNSSIFQAQYAKDQLPLPEEIGGKPPFTYCYLVDKEGPNTHIEVSQLVSMVGNSIFLDLTSEFQRQKKSNRDNYSAFLTEGDDLGCPQSFVSFGLSSLFFPKDKVRQACANRLAKEIIKEWMTPLDRSTNIPAFSAQEWSKLGLLRDDVKNALLHWEDGQGDGSIRDSIIAQWNTLNQSYAMDYPGHKSVAATFVAQDDDLTSRLRDTDPNPDVLQKLPVNLGEYTRGLQTNLRAQLPEKKNALSNWVAHIVNEPAHRHTVAREVLIKWGDLITGEVRAIEAEAKQTRELAKSDADRKSALTQKINDYASDFSLGMVPGARKKSIDEGKEEFVSAARSAHSNMVDERVSDYLLKFYQEIGKHLTFLMSELDKYIVLVTELRDKFASQEEQAISLPTHINGQVIFNPGVLGKNGFEGGDIAHYYALYAGEAQVVNKTQTDIRHALKLNETIYALKNLHRKDIMAQMLARCQSVFAGLDNESVLERFYQLYRNSPTQAENQFMTVWNAAQPFVKIDENDANWKFKDNLKCKPTVVGLMHGNEPETTSENEFLDLMKDQIAGLDGQNIARNPEPHEVLFIRERAAFPLRLLAGLDNYKYVYDQEKARGGANPIHTRADITQWIRIHPPSQAAQWNAWETFVIGWASGVIEEVKTRHDTVLGSSDFISYRVTYTDNFGFPKSDELGEWRVLNQWDASKMSFGGAQKVDTSRPPLEALDIVLTLCDKPTLCQQIERAMQIRRNQIGDPAFARAILAHAQAQQKTLTPAIYETYYKTIVGDTDASPPRDGYLQKSGLDKALEKPDESKAPDEFKAPDEPEIVKPPTLNGQWYYAVGNQQQGPVSVEKLRELAANGRITAQTSVWCAGMAGWLPASATEIGEFFPKSELPPPLPPPLPPQ